VVRRTRAGQQRDRSRFAYSSFWELLYEIVRRHELVEKVLVGLVVAERELGWPHLQDLPSDLLDLGDYGILDTVNAWRTALPDEKFELVHDTSKMIQKNRERWMKILDPTNPAKVVGQDRRTIQFPLPVTGLRLEESHKLASLQVADVVAGAACALLSARARFHLTDYARALLDSGLLSATLGGIWPSDAVTPEQLETEGPVIADSATYIAELIARDDAGRSGA